MALPLVRIVSALAPLVMGAFDLYRKRREAKEIDESSSAQEFMRSPEGLIKHLQELENADVEQARLISELSNTVEALATTLEGEMKEAKKRERRMHQLVWGACVFSVASLGLAVWALLRM